MKQIDKLNKSLSMYLYTRPTPQNKSIRRKIVFNGKDDLTKDEVFLIKKAIENHYYQHSKAFIIHISRRFSLDFIGWDNPKYYDVLICKTKNGHIL